MTGIQDVVFRIPEEWDPKWFEEIIKDLFQYADARNVEGIGILVSGTTDVVATYEVDEQNVDLAEGLETRAILSAIRQRMDLLELQGQRGMVRENSLNKRIEELEMSEQVVPLNSLKKRIEDLEIEVA